MSRGKTERPWAYTANRTGSVVGIVPAAGMGTRMGPLSKAVPKEMLPFGRYPLVEHAVAELTASGIEEICVVIREGKESLRSYLEMRREAFLPSRLSFATQEEPLGLGDALRRAAPLVADRPFLMAIPDQVLLSATPAAAQLLGAWGGGDELWNSLVRIPPGAESFFAGARPFRLHRDRSGRLVVDGILDGGDSPLRGFGRTLFPPGAMEYMTRAYGSPETGEVDLLRSTRALLAEFPSFGLELEGEPCDLGTWEGYLHFQGRYGASAKSEPPTAGSSKA